MVQPSWNGFEPSHQRELFVVEYQLSDQAKDRLAAESDVLSLVNNPKVVFAVRQQCPDTLDDAVTHIIEVETYLSLSSTCRPCSEHNEACHLSNDIVCKNQTVSSAPATQNTLVRCYIH